MNETSSSRTATPVHVPDDGVVAAVFQAFPSAAVDRDNIGFLAGLLERRLVVQVCAECGRAHHPPLAHCPACWAASFTPTPLSGAGTVILRTRVHHPYPAAGLLDAGPHVLVTIEPEQLPTVRITLPLIGGDIAIGEQVVLGWLDDGTVPMPCVHPLDASSRPGGED